METLLESKLWKFAMTSGVLTVVLGALILAWPGTSILIASTLFGVYLLLSGLKVRWLSPARVGRHAGPAVHKRRAVSDPGPLVLP